MSKYINIKSGRDNLALTVFVPWDCTKHCNFCTTKVLYKEEPASIRKIKSRIKSVLSKVSSIKDIVISGGEPLDNLQSLYDIIKDIDKTKYNVYVNTSFPKVDSESEIFQRVLHIVDGFNVSRHYGHNYADFCTFDEIIYAVSFNAKIRINILLNDHIQDMVDKDNFLSYIEDIKRYDYFDIQLRANYLKTSTVLDQSTFTLKDNDDSTSKYLIDTYANTYSTNVHISGCNVCNSVCVVYNGYNTISFHKGVKSTLIDKSTYYEVNDVIIFPNGDVKLDWTGQVVDVKKINDLDKLENTVDNQSGYNNCGKGSCYSDSPILARCS